MGYDFFIVYGLSIIAFFITLAAQIFVSSSYSNYKRIKNKKGISGQEAARIILDRNGLENIYVVEVKGSLTDHYDPTNKVVRLSSDIFHGESIASVAVACHECGHAIQDKNNYTFMRIRSSLVPFVNFSSYAGYFAILIGIFLSSLNLIWIGIFCEIIILIFQIITLPVEFDASRRALSEVEDTKILNSDELSGAKTMLVAAALTYVAGVCATILEIIRLILMFGRRDDD